MKKPLVIFMCTILILGLTCCNKKNKPTISNTPVSDPFVTDSESENNSVSVGSLRYLQNGHFNRGYRFYLDLL